MSNFSQAERTEMLIMAEGNLATAIGMMLRVLEDQGKVERIAVGLVRDYARAGLSSRLVRHSMAN